MEEKQSQDEDLHFEVGYSPVVSEVPEGLREIMRQNSQSIEEMLTKTIPD